jgi:DNA-binding XRE family transcriptional regulator
MRDRRASHARARAKIQRAVGGLCTSCGSSLTRRTSSESNPFRYRVAGRDVLLVGLGVGVCANCGQETADIPLLDELHGVIASTVVESHTALTGKEIRFLRTVADISAKDFANLLGVSPEHLSRIENDHTPSLGLATDRLARAIFLATRSGELKNLRSTLLDPHCGRGMSGTSREPERICAYKGREWHLAA